MVLLLLTLFALWPASIVADREDISIVLRLRGYLALFVSAAKLEYEKTIITIREFDFSEIQGILLHKNYRVECLLEVRKIVFHL